MDIYMIALRLVHILGGVLWAGWAFVLVSFVEPAVEAAGPEGGKFMQALAGKTRLVPVMLVVPTLTILTGILMYWRASGGLSGRWITSGIGLSITVGSLAGILAFISGLMINRPAAERLAALSREMQAAGGPPTPQQMAEIRALQEKLSIGGLYAAVLLVISVVGMSVAQSVWWRP